MFGMSNTKVKKGEIVALHIRHSSTALDGTVDAHSEFLLARVIHATREGLMTVAVKANGSPVQAADCAYIYSIGHTFEWHRANAEALFANGDSTWDTESGIRNAVAAYRGMPIERNAAISSQWQTD